MKKVVAILSVLAVCAAFSMNVKAADDGKPKWTIKQIMGACFKGKGKLAEKVAGGSASDEEKKEFHEMMEALGKNTPKKGDAESWKKKTSALVKAAEAAVKGDAGAGKLISKAKNCKACHSAHK